MASSHIITRENWQQVAASWKGVLSDAQVFDNTIDNTLVVTTANEKGFVPTNYSFDPSLKYHECSEIARVMTKEVNPHMDDFTIMTITFHAALS